MWKYFSGQKEEQQIVNTIILPDILLDEFEAAILSVKDGKTSGPIEVQSKMKNHLAQLEFS